MNEQLGRAEQVITCDVCDQNEAVGVAASSFGAVSFAYCTTCLEKRADVIACFDYCYAMNRDDVADWVRGMSTFIDGEYITWDQYVADYAEDRLVEGL